MAYVSTTYESFKGQVVADATGSYKGECVSYVKRAATGVPQTSLWKKVSQVKGMAGVKKGTAIATFNSHDRYFGHAAIFVAQNTAGLQVWDQWVGHAVAPRTIAFRGKGDAVNDGDQFFVIG